ISAGSPISGHIRTWSSGISRASCGFQRASESTEERNSNAIAIPLVCGRFGPIAIAGDSTMPRYCHIPARFLGLDGDVITEEGADAFAVADTGPAMAQRRRLGSPDRGFGHPRGLAVRWERSMSG